MRRSATTPCDATTFTVTLPPVDVPLCVCDHKSRTVTSVATPTSLRSNDQSCTSVSPRLNSTTPTSPFASAFDQSWHAVLLLPAGGWSRGWRVRCRGTPLGSWHVRRGETLGQLACSVPFIWIAVLINQVCLWSVCISIGGRPALLSLPGSWCRVVPCLSRSCEHPSRRSDRQ